MIFSRSNSKATAKSNNRTKKFIGLLFTVVAFSQAYAQLELTKHTINNGGNTMSGGGFELKSSIGQTDASKPSSGGNYNLSGGFWQQNNDLIFKNKF